MKLLKKLIEIRNNELFFPGFLGLFFNPFYFIRRGLYVAIRSYAHYMSGRLLDFGCGSKPFKKLFDVEEYIGLDIEKNDQRDINNDIDFYYDGNTIPFKDNYFDCIFSSEVFEHVFNLENILQELNRVCKSGGYILITVPFIWDEHEVPYDFGRYTSYGICHLLQNNSFEVIEQKKTTNYVQTVFQMWNTYIYKHIFKHKLAKLLLTPIVIAPVTIFALIISKILPQNFDFYHNNVVIAKKTLDNK